MKIDLKEILSFENEPIKLDAKNSDDIWTEAEVRGIVEVKD